MGAALKSVLQKHKRCLVCGSPYVEEHHVFEGSRRQASEAYGMKVYLCSVHHRGYPEGVHRNAAFAVRLKQAAQEAFERKHGHGLFMQVFKKSYL